MSKGWELGSSSGSLVEYMLLTSRDAQTKEDQIRKSGIVSLAVLHVYIIGSVLDLV